MAEKKNTTLELSVNPDYVRSWGLWEALRELLQNTIDSHEQGNAMEVSYGRTVGRASGEGVPLRLVNRGTKLSRDTLLLGTTSKADDALQRGQFGEGYKLAFLVLTRLGYQVVVKNDDELWKPFIGYSDTFGANVLKIAVSPRKADGNVSIEVYGIESDTWDTVQKRCLFLDSEHAPAADQVLDLGSGDKILLSDTHRNALFVRGIYVGPMPDGFAMGYDLPNVTLDRDRRLADPWSLRYEIKNALKRGVERGFLKPDQVMTLCNQETGEARAVLDSYRYGSGDSLTQKMAEAFKAEHGEDTVPVSSIAESADALSNGLGAVMVAESLKVALEKELGGFAGRKKTREIEVQSRFLVSDLTEEEMGNLNWAQELLESVEPDFDMSRVQVVEFFGDKIAGRVIPLTMEIAIARKVLTDPKETLHTLVHEYAHKDGDDGSFGHNDSQISILSRIAVAWLR